MRTCVVLQIAILPVMLWSKAFACDLETLLDLAATNDLCQSQETCG